MPNIGTTPDASHKQPGAGISVESLRSPLLSHASYSWDSSGRTPSASPTPPATPTHREISLSSFTNSDDRHRVNSDPANVKYPSRDHWQTSFSPSLESFVDIYSSSSPEFIGLPSPSRSKTRLQRPATGTGTGSSKSQAPLSNMASQPKLRDNKPPIPTAPKPSFYRSSSDRPGSSNQTRELSPNPMSRLVRRATPASTRSPEASLVPPTTNFLNSNERADLVKKNRKLAQVFGTTPGASVLSQRHDESQPDITLAPNSAPSPEKRRHTRGTQSTDNGSVTTWDVPTGTQYLSASSRRHSAPLSPSYLQDATDDENNPIIQISSEHDEALSEWSSGRVLIRREPASSTSFIDLSDEDTPNNDGSVISSSDISGRQRNRPAMNRRTSTFSILESMTPEEQEEEKETRQISQATSFPWVS